MKLKKIVSLALAGVLAVSMLTACGDKGSSSSSTNEVTSSATGVSAKVDALLTEKDKIDLTDNTTYQAYLSAAIKKADLKYDTLSAVTADWESAGVIDELKDTFEDNVVGYSTTSQAISDFAASKEDKVFMSVFTAPGTYTEEVVLNALATKLNGVLDKDALVSVVADSTTYYNQKYTGSVCMQKVTDGSASAWYVLVVVANDATKL